MSDKATEQYMECKLEASEEPRLCPTCGKELWGHEYAYDHPEAYDGISEWACPDGHIRIGRWTGKVLSEGESEKKYGAPTEPKDTLMKSLGGE